MQTLGCRDILLGLMKRLVKRRASNLKVIITSATLDGDKVSRFFSNCPVLNVPGKLYPVEILYSNERPKSYLEASLKTALGMSSVLCYFYFLSIYMFNVVASFCCLKCSMLRIVLDTC